MAHYTDCGCADCAVVALDKQVKRLAGDLAVEKAQCEMVRGVAREWQGKYEAERRKRSDVEDALYAAEKRIKALREAMGVVAREWGLRSVRDALAADDAAAVGGEAEP